MRALRFLLFSLAVLWIPFGFKKEFKLPPSHAQLPVHLEWDLPKPSAELEAILKTPFSYYAHGNQSTVFLSQDGQYVLKLFRYNRSLFPCIHLLRNWYKPIPKQSFLAKCEKTLSAAYLACTEGQIFTGALYCHLNLTKDALPQTTLQVGRKSYPISLDQTRFVLQRKADGFKETLLSHREDPEKIHQLLSSFADLLLNRSFANIRNSDPNLGRNFGFIDGRAVEIDFGNYQKISPDLQRQRREITHFFLRLNQWIAKCMPEYLDFAIDLQKKTEIAYIQKDEEAQGVLRS